MRIPFVLLILMCVQACGTITTLSNTDQRISSNLKKANTYCENVPRVYSGVSYNLCYLNAKPNDYGSLGNAYLIDVVLSSVSDTLVLPYTIYQQFEKGSIQVAH